MAKEEMMNEDDELLDDEAEQDDMDDETLETDDEPMAASRASSKTAEVIEDFSIASRQRARDELSAQVEAFLAKGGKISEVPPTFSADPPKKPTPDYGGRPI